jgi:hypothetical protein
MTGCGQADRRLGISERPLSQRQQIGWPCNYGSLPGNTLATPFANLEQRKARWSESRLEALVLFDITEPTRHAVDAWIGHAGLIPGDPVSDLDLIRIT